jgi:AbrB family looped-hinge helix DNA binding protein
MTITSISTKGQVTLPARLRKKLGLKPRDRVLVEIREGAIVISPAPDFFEKFEGYLGKAVPREEEQRLMVEGVAAHVLGKKR